MSSVVENDALLPDVENENGRDVLRDAIACQKRGESLPDLWSALLAECDLDPVAVNLLVQEHSLNIAQGTPRLDIYGYEECLRLKVKEHQHLLHALRQGTCFTNRKIDPDTYMVLFENEERLTAAQVASQFLSNDYLAEVISAAGEGIRAEWEENGDECVLSGVDRFFAAVREAPELLARVIQGRCEEIMQPRSRVCLDERLEFIQSLFNMMSSIFTAVQVKRHALQIEHGRDRLLGEAQGSDWLLDSRLHQTWDKLLYVSTQTLIVLTPTGFEDPMARTWALLSIQIGTQYCQTLGKCVLSQLMSEHVRQQPETAELAFEMPDRYASAIVNACFGPGRTAKADETVFQ